MTLELFNLRKREYEEQERMIQNVREDVDMKIHEKKTLKSEIEKLTENEQLKIYDIIVNNGLKNTMSVNVNTTLFDLSQLDKRTLWELDYYIKQCESSRKYVTINQTTKMESDKVMSELNQRLMQNQITETETEIKKNIETETETELEKKSDIKPTQEFKTPITENEQLHEYKLDEIFELSKSTKTTKNITKPQRKRRPRINKLKTPLKEEQTIESEPKTELIQVRRRKPRSKKQPDA